MNTRGITLIYLLLILFTACTSKPSEETFNIKEIVSRHDVTNEGFDKLASLSVGNGKFAMTVDATGLQTFPEDYADGIPLGMQSEWAWHKFPNTENYQLSETFEYYDGPRGKVSYAVSGQKEGRAKAASDFLRSNPHRIHLASIGLALDSIRPEMGAFQNIHQKLDLYQGNITSQYILDGEQVSITTTADQTRDAILLRIESPLVKKGRIQLSLRYPSPLGAWKDTGSNFEPYEAEKVTVTKNEGGLTIQRALNEFEYTTSFQASSPLNYAQKDTGIMLIYPENTDGEVLELVIGFNPSDAENVGEEKAFSSLKADAEKATSEFWENTAMLDVGSGATEQARELERRFILSKYLVHIQSGGKYPPQETGLTYNSWYGRPHLEMFYWHLLGQALTGEADRLGQQLDWYVATLPQAKQLAERQLYRGARWLKMTDPTAEEGPSNVGAFLIWQQPHAIYLSNLLYDIKKDKNLLDKYAEIVFETAEFMSDFAVWSDSLQSYRLGPPLIGAQERFNAKNTFNTSYEVAWWKQNLEIAIEWKKMLSQEVPEKWRDVAKGLPEIGLIDGMYTMAESAEDSYTNERYRTDHPMVVGIAGLTNYAYDSVVMGKTFDWIMANWSWAETWGWDYPMVSMAATDLGRPQTAVDVLLMDVQKNTYLKNGHNYQDGRLTLYMPGNTALMAAVAKMVKTEGGFPDGWIVKAKGFPGVN